jgi:hypothetical protein
VAAGDEIEMRRDPQVQAALQAAQKLQLAGTNEAADSPASVK